MHLHGYIAPRSTILLKHGHVVDIGSPFTGGIPAASVRYGFHLDACILMWALEVLCKSRLYVCLHVCRA